MKGSQELIAYFNKREEALGEKATRFNLFLEGYAEGYNDTKAEMINKACEWLKANAENYIVDIGTRDVNLVIGDMCWEDFRKAMEEEL